MCPFSVWLLGCSMFLLESAFLVLSYVLLCGYITICLFTCGPALGLFPGWGSCRWSCDERSRTSLHVAVSFLCSWVNAKERTGWGHRAGEYSKLTDRFLLLLMASESSGRPCPHHSWCGRSFPFSRSKGVRFLVVAVIRVSLLTEGAGHLLGCLLAVCIASLVRYLLRSFAHF